MRIGYAKIGRSMPLTLERCGNLGGDVEMIPVLQTLARRHPTDEFVLVGRNSGERPTDVGLPSNVTNPWVEWGPELRERRRHAGVAVSNLSVEQHLVTRRLFDDLTLDTLRNLDAFIIWVGQHGTTNAPLPGVRRPDELTKPYDWCAFYVSHVLRGVNAWRDADPLSREEVYLSADPRNDHKMRDLKWPLRHPVLTQYEFTKRLKHHRYGDLLTPGDYGLDDVTVVNRDTWSSQVTNVYARLEINALTPGTPFGDLITFNEDWTRRAEFGVFINETRRYVGENVKRVNVMRDWILPVGPAWIHGTWSDESQVTLGRVIGPVSPTAYFIRFPTVRATFTTPASGTGWATAKPWEAFACGVVCFFHPAYDTQDNVLGDAPGWLRDWLRVNTPDELRRRVRHLSTEAGRRDWYELIHAQRMHLNNALTRKRHVHLIEARIWEKMSRG